MAAIDDARARIETELDYWFNRMNDETFILGHPNVKPDAWTVVALALASLEGERLNLLQTTGQIPTVSL